MSLISEQLPNLMNGVSQQALTMRLASQSNRQVNGFSSLVEGVNKRMPLKFLKKIANGSIGDAYAHTINRDTGERYVVLVTNGAIRVFDLEGNEKTVTYPAGTSYITGANPSQNIRAITVADYTFLVNTTKQVETLSDLSPARAGEGFVFIRAVNYNTTYTVTVNGSVVATHTTVSAYATQPVVSIQGVVDALTTTLTTNLGAAYTVTKYSPIIQIKRNDGADFTLEITDTNGNTMSRAVYGKTQRFTDLPTVGSHGYIVRITGDEGSTNDDYWLKFTANKGSGVDSGTWEETVAPAIQTKLNPATMPHSLVRMPDGSFQLQQLTWGERVAGNVASAPWPSFVGKRIRDIFFDRNRLCVLADDNVVMSRAGGFFDFFRETVVTLLDGDPIDVAATGSKVSILQYAVPFNKQVVLFSDQTQFVIEADALLASEPPAVKEITAYEIDNGAKPVAVGKTVFFGVRRGRYSSLMEYFVIPDTETSDAADVSKHVPTYIPKDMFKLTASTTTDVVLTLNRTERDRVYVYKYYWQDGQKLQSSWSYWQFTEGCTILGVEFVGDTAYFVIQYADGVYIETLEVTEGVVDPLSTFVVRLDRRVDETQVGMSYNAVMNRTSITLPYIPSAAGVRVVTRPSESFIAGFTPHVTVDVVSTVGSVVTVVGDVTAKPFYVGEDYEFIYEFSKPVLKTQASSGGTASVAAGRLQINRWHVIYDQTGYFRAEVRLASGQVYTYVYSGKTLGTESATIGELTPQAGVFSFRVNSKADRASITIINDSFLPSYLTSAEWEGRFERKSSRA